MDLLTSKESLLVPDGGGAPESKSTVIDMRAVFKAESRLHELQLVNRDKAGDLLHALITGWHDARQGRAMAAHQQARAKRRLAQIHGIIILDRAVTVIKEKGLETTRSPAGSADLREAVVNTDPEYNRAAETLEMLEALVEYLTEKADTLKMAYFSVGHLLDPHDRSKADTSGGTTEPFQPTRTEKVQSFVQRHSKTDYGDDGFGGAAF
jgi:hypothetical protein